MKKLTNNEFIIKSNKKHNYEYDYSLVDYKNNRIKIVIICRKHGEFYQIPNSHLNGSGCPECGIIKSSLNSINKYNLKLSDRIYDCLVCKNSIDRDENSAINMKLLGSSSLSLDKLVSLKGNNKLYTFEYNL